MQNCAHGVRSAAPELRVSPLSSQESLLPRLVLTAVAASVAEAATYPIDAIKTQLQLQGAGQQHHKQPPAAAGALRLARRVLATQGAAGLYAGLPPAALRHCIYTTSRITIYEHLRSASSSRASGASGGSSSAGSSRPAPGLGAKLGMGLTAGAMGQLIAVPADLIKAGALVPLLAGAVRRRLLLAGAAWW
jgi:solute carrier family 25 uncoupling protein 27